MRRKDTIIYIGERGVIHDFILNFHWLYNNITFNLINLHGMCNVVYFIIIQTLTRKLQSQVLNRMHGARIYNAQANYCCFRLTIYVRIIAWFQSRQHACGTYNHITPALQTWWYWRTQTPIQGKLHGGMWTLNVM